MKLGFSAAVWPLVFAGLLLFARAASAQSAGDYDGDGDVDGDDFWYWSGCMTGPAEETTDPNCAAFDFDSGFARDGKVDLADFGEFGRVYTAAISKVPLGGTVHGTTNGQQFKVFVPTKWGGVLTVATTSGTSAELKYPDGSTFQNGHDTGENKHGWYKFLVSGSTSYTVSASFLQEGQATRRPWNFYWWSSKGDYIHEPASGGNGVANTTANGTDQQIIAPGLPASPGANIVLCGTDGTLETTPTPDDQSQTVVNLFDRVNPYRPLDKYDQLHGGYPRQWEADHDAGTTDDWWGHCWGASMASILLPQPTKAAGTPYTTDGEELEGLWAELGDGATYNIPHGIAGIPPGPPVPGNDPSDVGVAGLHSLFEEWIRAGHVALQSNLRPAPDPNDPNGPLDPNAIWNHAVYKYRAVFTEASGGNERIVQIANEIEANKDTAQFPTTGEAPRSFTYTYIVEYGNGAVLPGGIRDFVGVTGQARFAPTNMYHVTGASWHAPNIYVFENDVRADDAAN